MVNYSQASQDLFVIKMLENKRDGFYVEVGGSDPIRINNTYLLEKDFGWAGFSLEKDATLAATYNSVRKNVCHNHDALSFDFRSEISKMLNGGSQVDYLSLDIEPGTQTLKCLTSMPHEEYRFSVITFEHEMYSEGPAVRDNCRKFLNDLGYQLVVGDVKNFGHSYEDWFVDPKIIKESVWGPFVKSGVEHSQLGL